MDKIVYKQIDLVIYVADFVGLIMRPAQVVSLS